MCLPLYQEGKYFPRNPTANFPLGATVQSWINCHLDKIRILLERKSIRKPKTEFMVSVPKELMMAL